MRQSTPPARISASNAARALPSTYGSSEPTQTNTVPVMLRASSGREVPRPGWTDHGPQVGPAAGQLEHQGATKAVADGGHLGRIDPWMDPQDLERAVGDGAGPMGIVADGSDPLADAGIVEPESPAAVGVEGERDVAALGQPVGTLAMHVVEARRLVSHQHGG